MYHILFIICSGKSKGTSLRLCTKRAQAFGFVPTTHKLSASCPRATHHGTFGSGKTKGTSLRLRTKHAQAFGFVPTAHKLSASCPRATHHGTFGSGKTRGRFSFLSCDILFFVCTFREGVVYGMCRCIMYMYMYVYMCMYTYLYF